MRSSTVVLLLAFTMACAPGDEMPDDPTPDSMSEEVELGPRDGHDLSPTDLERVGEGDMAPDFTLTSLAGPPVTLSDFRGGANVVLVFYRGHW